MFHPLLAKGRDAWLARPDCPARGLLASMRRRGALRPVQIDALATYLFLKLRCGNAPLWRIFMDGLWEPPLWPSTEEGWRTRETYMKSLREDRTTAPAMSLLDAADVAVEPEARKANFTALFYDVAYPDYLFSLPMGAGKTYLMAAMIYLNLYFAEQDPGNPTFAHNFLVLAPSGTKSSIVPSLRKIRDFDPAWVLTEDTEGLMKGWRLTLTAFRSDRLAKEVEALNAKAVFQPSAKGRKVITLSDKGLEVIEWVGVDTHRGPLAKRRRGADRALGHRRPRRRQDQGTLGRHPLLRGFRPPPPPQDPLHPGRRDRVPTVTERRT